MHFFNDDTPDDLIHEAQAERRYLKQLSRHPDPRDPDHPEQPEEDMTEPRTPWPELSRKLNRIHEILTDALEDMKKGNAAEVIAAIKDCTDRLEEIENPENP
jgi:hypothetical protein